MRLERIRSFRKVGDNGYGLYAGDPSLGELPLVALVEFDEEGRYLVTVPGERQPASEVLRLLLRAGVEEPSEMESDRDVPTTDATAVATTDEYDKFDDLTHEQGGVLTQEPGNGSLGSKSYEPTPPLAVPPGIQRKSEFARGDAAVARMGELLSVGLENLNELGLGELHACAESVRDAWHALLDRHETLSRIETIVRESDPGYVTIQGKAEADAEMLTDVERKNAQLGSLAGSSVGAEVRVSGTGTADHSFEQEPAP